MSEANEVFREVVAATSPTEIAALPSGVYQTDMSYSPALFLWEYTEPGITVWRDSLIELALSTGAGPIERSSALYRLPSSLNSLGSNSFIES